eukprot:CAMPEP_0172680646 /NCGR_PEP_ID=MMETSP1074-20121228/16906_1 /TAXON_ID=2916 /ORGANISM="Ceratium fusus, Strain PA161109" /LENGTH=430 /DNA_ID=CAMNT_0013499009 /DNA_START=39 /DNA_END=1328 /DNA_ORIENTATION=+
MAPNAQTCRSWPWRPPTPALSNEKGVLLRRLRSPSSGPGQVADAAVALEARGLLTGAKDYTAVFGALAAKGLLGPATRLWRHLRQQPGLKLDVVLCSAWLRVYSTVFLWTEALCVLSTMQGFALLPDSVALRHRRSRLQHRQQQQQQQKQQQQQQQTRFNLGSGFCISGVRQMSSRASGRKVDTQRQQPELHCVLHGPPGSSYGLADIAATAEHRWALWSEALREAARVLGPRTSTLRAVTLAVNPEVSFYIDASDMPTVSSFSPPPSPLALPVSFLHSPLEPDIESGWSLEVQLLLPGGGPVLAMRHGDSSPDNVWSSSPSQVLSSPSFDDGEHGPIDEAEGCMAGALRTFRGHFVLAQDAPGEIFSEWSLLFPPGKRAVLRTGPVVEGRVNWYIRGHQQVGGTYWALDAEDMTRSSVLICVSAERDDA